MATRPFIGLKRVWYGDVVKTVTTPETGYTAAELKALIATMTEVKNVHQDTWGYEEALQGGKATDDGWERTDMTALVEKSIVAMTKTGNFIFMPKANIVGKGSFVEKKNGLCVSAVPLETKVK